MIDLATTVGADTPAFLNERHRFWMERPPASPFVGGGTIGFTEGGQEFTEDTDSYSLSDQEHLSAEALLDEIIVQSRRDVERFPSSARTHANLGLALFNRGHVEEAAAAFEAALGRDPNQYIATANLARIWVLQDRLTDAQELYERLRASHPTDPNPVLGLADIAERRGDTDEAIRRWSEAIALRPSSAVAHSNLGALLLRIRRHREAIACLKTAARMEPRRATTHNALGVAYALVGEKSRAVRSFRIALSLAPRMPDAILGLASVLLDAGRARETVEVLEGYVGQVAGDYEAHELLARAYIDLGDYQAARGQWFRALEALQRSDGDTSLHRARLINNLGVCYLHLRAFDEALRRFRDSISLLPESAVPYQNLARLYLDTQQPKQASDILRACEAELAGDETTRLMLAFALERQGKPKEAVDELRAWIASGHATIAAWTSLGYLITDDMRQPAEAVQLLEEAHRRWPESARVANNLAYAHLMNEDPRAARSVLESMSMEAEQRDAVTNIVLRATWGLLHLWEGDFGRAEKGYRQASEEAKRHGMGDLSQAAYQKMHLEFARAYWRLGKIDEARREVRAGIGLPGERRYRQDLRNLADELRIHAKESRMV